MKNVVQGVLDFRRKAYLEHKDLFGELAEYGQNPEVLLVTCSDSRIDPHMLTGTDPGDLFICRNAGNIIPPHGRTGGITASIEFATAMLDVKTIIVCGHTDCGAVRGALDIDSVKSLPHVYDWLGHCRSAMEIVRERNGIPTGEPIDLQYLDEAIDENVRQQVQHLRTHPTVAAKIATGKVMIHGWVYDIRSGGIRCCSLDNPEFIDFDQMYASVIADLKHESAE